MALPSTPWCFIVFIVGLMETCSPSTSNFNSRQGEGGKIDSVSLIGRVRPDPQVHVHGGTVQLGSADHDQSNTGKSSRMRLVHLGSLKVDRYPVTNGDFMVFTSQKTQYKTDAEKRGYSWVVDDHVSNMADVHDHRDVSHGDGPQWRAVRNATWWQPFGVGSSLEGVIKHPVVHVSYQDAFAFCVWAKKRLATEDEWEFAAGAAVNGSVFPWGTEFIANRSNLRQVEISLFDISSGLSPVDQFQRQNHLGLHDLIGNVWEWTSTVFTEPHEKRDLNRPQHVAKGGSFVDTWIRKKKITISARSGLSPDYSSENVGFRCVESDPGADKRQPVRHRLSETWIHQSQERSIFSKFSRFSEEL